MGSITDKALAVGQIEPRQKFQVKSKVSGLVKTCVVQVGDTVKPGDPLFEIQPDPTPQDLIEVDRTVESAQASFDRAKADYERYKQLFAQGVVSKGDLDMKREQFELAQVALQRARENRELTTKGRVSGGGAAMETIIRAPAAGTILTRAVNPGDPIVPLTSFQPGTEMATIAEMSDLIFKGTVDEIDVGKMKVGLPVRIKVGALPTDVVTGKVSRIAPQAQKKEGSTLFDVEIELDPNAERRPARGVFGQRRRGHPREEGHPHDPRTPRDLRGRGQEDLRRNPRGKAQGSSPRRSRSRRASPTG